MLQIKLPQQPVDEVRISSDQPLLFRKGLVAVLGPNGAGKSSLLLALAGKEAERVSLNGRSLASLGVQQRAQQIAILHQTQSINFPFLVSEVVSMGCFPHSWGASQCQQQLERCLQQWELQPLAGRSIDQLSGGELQRVHLARFFAQISEQTSVLLLDEPLSALDLRHQQRLMVELKRLAEQGVLVIMTVHDPLMAARFADQLLFVKEGRVEAFAETAQLWRSEPLSSLYHLSLQVGWHNDEPWLRLSGALDAKLF